MTLSDDCSGSIGLREDFAKNCFETLLEFSLLDTDASEQDSTITNRLAITSLLQRFKEVIQRNLSIPGSIKFQVGFVESLKFRSVVLSTQKVYRSMPGVRVQQFLGFSRGAQISKRVSRGFYSVGGGGLVLPSPAGLPCSSGWDVLGSYSTVSVPFTLLLE